MASVIGWPGRDAATKVLESLPDEHVVFHDYHPAGPQSGGKWSADHIVVGPTGVYFIRTKKHRRAHVESRDGRHQRNLDQAERDAKAVKESLVAWSDGELTDVLLVPVLVYVHDDAFVDKPTSRSVRAIPLRWLRSEILDYPVSVLNLGRAHRVAQTFYQQLDVQTRITFEFQFDCYGEYCAEASANGRRVRTPSTKKGAERAQAKADT